MATLSDYLASAPTGTRARLARALSVAPAYLYQMERGLRPLSPRRVIPLARATGWAVTPHELRPDIYPHATDGLPQKGKARAA